MKVKTIRCCGAMAVLLVWAVLTGSLWFSPAKEISVSERRPLEQMPQVSAQTLLDGSYMKDFEKGAPDQFPMRDGFRRLKALFHYYALRQKDNNDIYLADGYAAQLLYPMNQTAVEKNLGKLDSFYETYLKDTNVNLYAAVIPDKSYYLAEANGYLAMDYEALFAKVGRSLPWAEHIDLTQSLEISDYYATDIHWRQENLFEAAGTLAQAMGITAPRQSDFVKTPVERPFYGVYYGQAALPMEPDTMYIMENEMLKDCTVTVLDDNSTAAIYDQNKLNSRDLYDIFLSGSRSVVVIENPNAKTDKELVIFRDSFGSSVAPLLLQDYAKVTLADIRYIYPNILANFLHFDDQDVLFLYCTTVLNTPDALK